MKRASILFMVLGLMIGTVVAAEAKEWPGRAERRDVQAPAGPGGMVAVIRGHAYYPSTGSDGVIIARHGNGLDLINLDEHSHTLTSFQWKNGRRLFGSRGPVAPNGTGAVRGVENLDLGRYRFFCTSHPEMRGILEVRHI